MFYSTNISDYQVGKQLGKGSFSTVYECRYNGQLYALKVTQKKLLRQVGMLQRVQNEIDIQKSCAHPNIVALYHNWEDFECIYLLTEYCLCDLYQKYAGKSAGADTQRLVKDILNGVAYLHRQGILHRDLKLSNVMLSKDGQAKVGDFGLVTRIQPNRSHRNSINMNEAMTMCGTANYISPECLNRQNYGVSTDIWSCGVVLFTLLCGYAPFEAQGSGHNVRETLERIKRGNFTIPSHLPVHATDLIMKMLNVDSQSRITADQALSHPYLNPFGVSVAGSMLTSSPMVQLEPLNTDRLKPIKQQTKHGVVEILSDGYVKMELTGDKYMFRISPRDSYIIITDKSNGLDQFYTLISLPQKFHKKYQYAWKFINVVRSKTPRIIYNSQDAKCVLMDNCQDAECTVGALKFRWNSESKMVDISGDGLKCQYHSSQLPYQYQEQFQKLQQGYKVCMEANSKNPDRFPHMVTDSYLQSTQQTQPAPDPVASRFGQRQELFMNSQSSTMLPRSSMTRGPYMNPLTATTRTSNMPSLLPIQSTFNETLQTAHIPGVGWCIQLTGKNAQFTLLLDDGAKVIVETPSVKGQTCYVTVDQENRYPIDKSLPMSVKRRLQYFPQFVKLLQM